MAIEWSDELAVRVPSIDIQHKELVKAINDLTEAMWQGKGMEEAGSLLDFLADYVVFHFGDEEKLMVLYGFPGYEAHKAVHEEFVRKFVQTRSQYQAGEFSSRSVIDLMDQTWDWLRNHIRKLDRELGDFMANRP
jgi:hemerythrin